MAESAAGPEDVRAAVVHFIGHWRGPQRRLAEELAALMEKLGVKIPGGRSAKALSAWKTGRQLPQDARLLMALRKIVNCNCGGYTNTDLDALLNATKQVGERSPASTAPKSWRPASYLAAVHDIAPTSLSERTAEIALIHEFCMAGHPYEWWKGPPWAGKTALAAWIALHPPPKTRVVCFLVNNRLPGRADSYAYGKTIISQLADILDEPVLADIGEDQYEEFRSDYLRRAAERAGRKGERILLIVDGLDEDSSDSSRPSIASSLPRRPPKAVKVLVTSRHSPDLPSDVPPDHPLRSCPARILSSSPAASGERYAAEDELTRHLRGQQSLAHEILRFTVASGGGLGAKDLATLTRATLAEVEVTLHGTLGRSLLPSAGIGEDDETEPVYFFAHAMLQQVAEMKLSDIRPEYLRRIHDWADGYQGRRWADAPVYLLRPYSSLVRREGDHERLALLALDEDRREWMHAATGSDVDAATEIADAQRLSSNQARPDFEVLAILAVQRNLIGHRYSRIPADLPALWARLGYFERAQMLIRAMDAPEREPDWWGRLVTELIFMGRLEQAEIIAENVPPGEAREDMNPEIWAALAKAGRVDRLRHIAAATGSDDDRDEALFFLAIALRRGGEADEAAAVLDRMQNSFLRSEASRDIEEPERSDGHGWDPSQPTLDPDTRATIRRLLEDADDAEQLVAVVSNGNWRNIAGSSRDEIAGSSRDEQDTRKVDVVAYLAGDGRPVLAAKVAGAIADGGIRAEALTLLGGSLITSDPGAARRLAEEAERAARESTPPDMSYTREQLAIALALGGPQPPRTLPDWSDEDLDDDIVENAAERWGRSGHGRAAERLARTLWVGTRMKFLGALVMAYMDLGDWTSALRALRIMFRDDAGWWRSDNGITVDRSGGTEAVCLVAALIRARRWKQAADVIRIAQPPIIRMSALGVLACRLPADDEPGRAKAQADAAQEAAALSDEALRAFAWAAFVAQAERSPQSVTNLKARTSHDGDWALDRLVMAAAFDESPAAVDRIIDALGRDRTSIEALSFVAARMPDSAEARQTLLQLAEAELDHFPSYDSVEEHRHVDLAGALAGIHQWDLAEQIADNIPSPYAHATAMARIGPRLANVALAPGAPNGLAERNSRLLARTLVEPYWEDAMLWLVRTDENAAVRLLTYLDRLAERGHD